MFYKKNLHCLKCTLASYQRVFIVVVINGFCQNIIISLNLFLLLNNNEKISKFEFGALTSALCIIIMYVNVFIFRFNYGGPWWDEVHFLYMCIILTRFIVHVIVQNTVAPQGDSQGAPEKSYG